MMPPITRRFFDRAEVQLPVLLGWGVLAYALGSIQSYLLVSDPAYYMQAGRALAEGRFSELESLRLMAPGYPFLIACAYRLGGVFAPYYLNLIGAGLALLMLILMLRGMRPRVSRSEEWLTVSCWLAALFLLDQRLPHFTLYPFRDIWVQTSIFSALACALRVPAGGHPLRWSAMAGGCVLLGASIREPAALAFLPVLLIVSSGGGQPPPVRVRVLRAMTCLTPLLLILGTGLLLYYYQGRSIPNQGHVYLRKAGRLLIHQEGRGLLLEVGLRSARELYHTLTPWGAMLIVLGLFRFRARKLMWAALLLTALAFFLLYTFVVSHPRYHYRVISLFTPLAGAGLFLLFRFVVRVLPSRIRETGAVGLAGIAVMGLVGSCLYVIQGLPRWGGELRARDIREQVDTLRNHLPPDITHVVVSPECRQLASMIELFTDYRLSEVHYFHKPWLRPETTPSDKWVCISSANEHARDPQANWKGMQARSAILRGANLQPVKGGQPLRLAAAEYHCERILPWSHHLVVQSADTPGDGLGSVLLWVDLQDCERRALKLLHINHHEYLLGPVRGWQALWVPENWLADQKALQLELAAECPLPRPFDMRLQQEGDWLSFPLDARRGTSERFWFDEISRGGNWPRYGPAFSEELQLRLPVRSLAPLPAGTDPVVLQVEITGYCKNRVHPDPVVDFRWGKLGNPQDGRAVPSKLEGRNAWGFTWCFEKPLRQGRLPLLKMKLTDPAFKTNPVQLHEIRFRWIRKAVPAPASPHNPPPPPPN